MRQQSIPFSAGRRFFTIAIAAAFAWVAGLASISSHAQGGFQIVWVNVGEAATTDGSGSSRAGRRLFGGSDLASMSLNNIRVSRVEVDPAVTEITVGSVWCLSALDMRAFGPERELIPEAPLSITVRQDHRAKIRLKRTRKDICLRPVDAGEYPVRLTSLLPAPDGSMRGAQVFLRVRDETELVTEDSVTD